MIEAIRTPAIVRYMEEHDLQADSILRRVGIQPTLLTHPHARIPFARHVALLEAAAAALKDDLLGIRLGATYGTLPRWLYSYILFNSPTVSAAIRNAGRYLFIHNEGMSWELVEDDRRATGNQRRDLLEVELVITDPAASGSVQQIGYALANAIDFIQRATRQPFAPEWIEVQYTQPRDPAETSLLLGSRVRYGTGRNAIIFKRFWYDSPIIGADNHLYAILANYADQVLADRLRGIDLVDQLGEWLVKRLPGGRFDAKTAAHEFGLSVRTLSRRLAQRQTTYGQLIGEIRSRLALRYVSDYSLHLARVAYLLGYADPTSFSKAFKQQFGCSPQLYRREHSPC